MASSYFPTMCICNRQRQDIFCSSCGYVFVGRVQKKCLKHPNDFHLMDSACCPKCMSAKLMEIQTADLSVNVASDNDVKELRHGSDGFQANNVPKFMSIGQQICDRNAQGKCQTEFEMQEQTGNAKEMKQTQRYSSSGNLLVDIDVQTDCQVQIIGDHQPITPPCKHHATKGSFIPNTVGNDSYGYQPKQLMVSAEENFLREVLKRRFSGNKSPAWGE